MHPICKYLLNCIDAFTSLCPSLRYLAGLIHVPWLNLPGYRKLYPVEMPSMSLIVRTWHLDRMQDQRLKKDVMFGTLFCSVSQREGTWLRFKHGMSANLIITNVQWRYWYWTVQGGRPSLQRNWDAVDRILREATMERHRKGHNEYHIPASIWWLYFQQHGRQCQ